MIIVPLKEGENIERALKKFKRKFEKTGVVKELRESSGIYQTVCTQPRSAYQGCLQAELAAGRGVIFILLNLFFSKESLILDSI